MVHRMFSRPDPPALTGRTDDGDFAFVCNLCNTPNRVPFDTLKRETPSCARCASTVRSRSIAQLLVRELFGEDRALTDVPASPHIRGIGLSDATTYAPLLARKFSYTNSYFDEAPQLDITAVPETLAGRHQFVIASDVFEHVAPPVSRAFEGARRLLDADGVLILTVPFSLERDTVEHFPELHQFSIVGTNGGRRLLNVTRDGRTQTFDGLVFHGGPGATLEMRLFSRSALEHDLRNAGFSRVRFADEAYERFGIVWPEPWSVPVVARP
jgi:hypothetical protein